MSTRSASALVGITVVAGTLGGLCVALTWRYTTPRRFLETHIAALRPGDPAFVLEVVDRTKYVSGPEWFPIVIEMPVLGLLAGLTYGVVLWFFLIRGTPRRFSVVVSTVGALVTGITTGVVGAALVGNRPARVFVESVTTSKSDGPSRYVDLDHLAGAPPYVDLQLTPYLTFSAAGAFAATAVSVVTVMTYEVFRRTKSAQTEIET